MINNHTNIQIKFKTTMLKFVLFDYSGVYIIVKGDIKVAGKGGNAAVRATDKNKK